ncbi:pimeloyl-ACP methyl ester esterase BioH [Pantoea sp. 1.19]|uniref:pimeloyl-ACP methyl ester esterase BioH n=1 Tax=Pantoea sp. 1.19 TaxID=1925589 RepID=UPI000948E7DB|nr:pimeloyl-ACP methyl ester esterase BioH [Pantoea sp. 1.19]
MTTLYWQTLGEGNTDLVMLHGWGLNAEVWQDIVPRLRPHFRLHLVDLPGYGRSGGWPALPLTEMAAALSARAPARALWLGWSLGGLVATQFALSQPAQVRGLITVASSPCFTACRDWPGIAPETLDQFSQQLGSDYARTVERFLALQTLGTASARGDARRLKAVVLSQPQPPVAVLEGGLAILRDVDLRPQLATLTSPALRLYGHLDGLVPRRIATALDTLWPSSRSQVIDKAAHAPFISHPEAFCDALLAFSAEAR